MWGKLAIAIFFLTSITAQAQVTPQIRKQLEAELDGKGSSKFQRLTSQGKFLGCELQFQQSFRDARSGPNYRLVNTVGSIVSYWAAGKAFNIIVKAKPAWITIQSNAQPKMDDFNPAYAGLALGRTSLEKFRKGRFVCEGGGECVGYADNNKLELMESAITYWSQGPVVLMTINQNGHDQRIEIHRLESGLESSSEFATCLGEIIEETQQWLKSRSKN